MALTASSERPKARTRGARRWMVRDTSTREFNRQRGPVVESDQICVKTNKKRKCRMQAARLHIEALLRARRLDRTVTDAGAPADPVRAVPTGLSWLDPLLAGGWPCGET